MWYACVRDKTHTHTHVAVASPAWNRSNREIHASTSSKSLGPRVGAMCVWPIQGSKCMSCFCFSWCNLYISSSVAFFSRADQWTLAIFMRENPLHFMDFLRERWRKLTRRGRRRVLLGADELWGVTWYFLSHLIMFSLLIYSLIEPWRLYYADEWG